jgi:hypothetical protein
MRYPGCNLSVIVTTGRCDVSRAVGFLLVGILVAACSAPPLSSRAAVTPSCERPPTIIFGENGTPIPIVLQCDKAVAEATRAIPAAMSGTSGSRITSIDFGYGRYCPPGSRCGPFAGQGELGFVLFGFTDGSSWLASVIADPNGVVRVTNNDPTPTRSPSAGTQSKPRGEFVHRV